MLNMARRKGFLDQEEEGRKDMGLKDLICKDYKIDDKSRRVMHICIWFIFIDRFSGKTKRRMIGKEVGVEIAALTGRQVRSLRRRGTSPPSTWSTSTTMAAQ